MQLENDPHITPLFSAIRIQQRTWFSVVDFRLWSGSRYALHAHYDDGDIHVIITIRSPPGVTGQQDIVTSDWLVDLYPWQQQYHNLRTDYMYRYLTSGM
jgi:FAD/FMN-containing dehydrogenase